MAVSKQRKINITQTETTDTEKLNFLLFRYHFHDLVVRDLVVHRIPNYGIIRESKFRFLIK